MNSPLLPTILLGTIATVTLIQPVAVSLSPTEINDKAKQFIVKIDGSDAAPKGNGSGSIIGRNGNNYQVLTNWHVVSESDNFNDYKIQTSDGTIHAVTQIKRLNGADLAIINFSSSNSYSVAKLGDSRNLTEGQTIHFSGYPAQKPRSYLFYPNQNINGFIPTASAEDGYEIIFTGAIVPGMSGSPLLNENGEIIGIYGRGGFGGPLYSIRVNTAISLAQQQGLNIASGSPSPPSNLTTTPITREPQLTAVEWFNKGEDLGKNEDYLEAINAFTQAIRLNPNYNIFYYNRGVAYNKLGNYQRAIEDHNQAIRLDPNYVFAYVSRGFSYIQLGDYQRAIEDLNKAIRLDPNSAFAYSNRGLSYGKLGDYQRAIEDLNKAIRLDPNFAIAYNNRGFFYNKLGNYQKAIENLNKAIRLKPNLPNAYNHRGFAYEKLGNYQRAIENYEEAIRLDPNYTTAKRNLESILRRR